MNTSLPPQYQTAAPPEDDRLRISRSGPPVPVCACVLICINIAVFLFIRLRFGDVDASFYCTYGGMYPPAVADGEWWRLITCTFFHANAYHLFNNMVMLFAAGAFVEDALGKGRFLILYFASGALASLVSFLSAGTDTGMVSIGASGAIFGLIGALVFIVLRHKGRYKRLSIRGMLFMVVLSVYYGFASGGFVDNAAHLGGIIAGFLLAILLYHPHGYKNTNSSSANRT